MKAVLFTSLALSLLLSACGKSGGITGTWVLDTSVMKKKMQESMNKAGMKDSKAAAMFKKSMQGALAAMDRMKSEIVLHGDGTYTYSTTTPHSTTPQEGKGTWKLEKDVLTLTPTSGAAGGMKRGPVKFRYNGTTLVPEDDPGGKNSGMVYRKG